MTCGEWWRERDLDRQAGGGPGERAGIIRGCARRGRPAGGAGPERSPIGGSGGAAEAADPLSRHWLHAVRAL